MFMIQKWERINMQYAWKDIHDMHIFVFQNLYGI